MGAWCISPDRIVEKLRSRHTHAEHKGIRRFCAHNRLRHEKARFSFISAECTFSAYRRCVSVVAYYQNTDKLLTCARAKVYMHAHEYIMQMLGSTAFPHTKTPNVSDFGAEARCLYCVPGFVCLRHHPALSVLAYVRFCCLFGSFGT